MGISGMPVSGPRWRESLSSLSHVVRPLPHVNLGRPVCGHQWHARYTRPWFGAPAPCRTPAGPGGWGTRVVPPRTGRLVAAACHANGLYRKGLRSGYGAEKNTRMVHFGTWPGPVRGVLYFWLAARGGGDRSERV